MKKDQNTEVHFYGFFHYLVSDLSYSWQRLLWEQKSPTSIYSSDKYCRL